MITPFGDINRLLKQMHEPDEYHLAPYDLTHPIYWIWIFRNAVILDLANHLRKNVKEHARFNVFVNGQFIGPKDYIIEQFGAHVIVKFKKNNFQYQLDSTDIIKIDGDVQLSQTPTLTTQLVIPSALQYLDNENDTPLLQETGDKIFLI